MSDKSVLHIWNIAGVASLMSKELKRNGYKSEVISRDGYDPFNIGIFYGDTPLKTDSRRYISNCLHRAYSYDIIHVHALYKIIPQLRNLYPFKKIVLQYHGTELTQCIDKPLRIKAQSLVDNIICSTQDLHKILNNEGTNNTLIDNAVDTDHFKPIPTNKKDNALKFDIRYINTPAVENYLKNHCEWEYETIDRELNPIMYKDLPNILNSYNRYIDIKLYDWEKVTPHQALSKTARECLSCGLEVFTYNNKVIKGLPIEYTPEYMIKRLISLYEE